MTSKNDSLDHQLREKLQEEWRTINMLIMLVTALNNGGESILAPAHEGGPCHLHAIGPTVDLAGSMAALALRNNKILTVVILPTRPEDPETIVKKSDEMECFDEAQTNQQGSASDDFLIFINSGTNDRHDDPIQEVSGVPRWSDISLCGSASDVFRSRYALLVCLYHLLILYP